MFPREFTNKNVASLCSDARNMAAKKGFVFLFHGHLCYIRILAASMDVVFFMCNSMFVL